MIASTVFGRAPPSPRWGSPTQLPAIHALRRFAAPHVATGLRPIRGEESEAVCARMPTVSRVNAQPPER